MSRSWRTLKVFLSSTFRDMNAERDHLVSVVFPALRERLEPHRVHLVDVDYRWGVTREQVEDRRVIDICFEQIDECRPLFVAFLGERYGAELDDFPPGTLARYGWLREHCGKSLTELEILHAALKSQPAGMLPLFCLRDAGALADVPEPLRRSTYVEADEARRGKLEALKRSILGSGYAVVNDYPARWDAQAYDRAGRTRGRLAGLERFGESVLEHLWAAARAALRLPNGPAAEAAPSRLEEEHEEQERFIDSRLRVYVGRDDIQGRLVAYVRGDSRLPLLLTGASGAGKSAALIRLCRSEEFKPDLLVPHFVGAGTRSTGVRRMLRRICLTLRGAFSYADEVPQDLISLVATFREFVNRVPPKTSVAIVIDAVDQLDDAELSLGLEWLFAPHPVNVKVVVSCSEEAEVYARVSAAADERGLPRVRVGPLNNAERAEIIRRVPLLWAKLLEPEQVDLLLQNPNTTKPLFLLVALEELRGFGSYEQLNGRIAALPRGPAATAELFAQVIVRLEEEFDKELVGRVLTLLAAARRGLSESELSEMVADLGSAGDLFPALRQLRPYLLNRAGLIDFYHQSFLNAVRARYLDTAEKLLGAHGRIARYFHAQPFWLDDTAGGARQANTRKVDEVVWQWLKAGRWSRAEGLLTDISFLEAKAEAGAVFDLVNDFSECLRVLPSDHPRRHLLRVLKTGLGAEVHFIASHPTTLFQCLWNNCWWYDCAAGRSGGESLQARPSDAAVSGRGGEVSRLLEYWRERKKGARTHTWLRSLRPPQYRLSAGLRFVLRGHQGEVKAVVSSDSRRIASTSSDDNTVRIWDANEGHELLRYENLPHPQSLAFSPDGQHLAVGMLYEEIHLLDARSRGEVMRLSSADQAFRSVSFSPDGKSLAAGCMGLVRGAGREILQQLYGTVRVWDLSAQTVRISMHPHGDYVQAVAFAPDGRSIVSGADDGTLRLWDAHTGAQLARWQAYTEWSRDSSVVSVSFSPDGRRVAAGTWDGRVWLWDVATGEALACCTGHEDYVSSVCFSPDGRRLASGSGDATIRLWDASDGARLHVLRGHLSAVSSVAFLPDGRFLVSGSGDTTVRIWEPSASSPAVAPHHRQTIQHLAASPDGSLIAAAGSEVRVWDAEGRLIASSSERAKSDYVFRLAFLDDGRTLAAAYRQSVLLWHAGLREGAGFTSRQLQGESDIPDRFVFSRDGRRCAMIVFARAKARIWDARGGSELATFLSRELGQDGRPLNFSSLAFSLDGEHLAVGTEGYKSQPEEETPFGGGIDVWWVEGARHKAHLPGTGCDVTSLAFSPDGARLAAGYYDHTVRIWDVAAGTFVACEGSHRGPVTVMAFSSDGTRVASADGHRLANVKDFTVRVWDARTGDCLGEVEGSKEARRLAEDFPSQQWRARAVGAETLIQSVATGEAVAWHPGVFHQL
ncbi:MAG: DUF4062 domain-containing protein, partial [Acidobacteriota bacterium]|nr:DUF4062 domain-containing protein [Acidobacteriota bacterium]